MLGSNNSNFIKGAPGEPVLISWDDATTLFHEFGHGLHGLMTQIRYPRFAGTSGSPRDYTEFPAQILEHWTSEPEMLEIYATHYETGDVIPAELVERLLAAGRDLQRSRRRLQRRLRRRLCLLRRHFGDVYHELRVDGLARLLGHLQLGGLYRSHREL